MPQVILKYAILTSIFLLTAIPFIGMLLGEIVEQAIKFASIGGMMMFGINEYLKKHNQNKSYNYLLGVIISFLIGSAGVLLFAISLIIYFSLHSEKTISLNGLFLILKSTMLSTIILSFLVPSSFVNLGENKEPEEMDDVLDY